MRPAGRLVRALCRCAPSLHLVPSPGSRPEGISVIVRVKNEEAWIEPCLRSVRAIADELIVVDNGSTDRTPERLAALARELGPVMRLFSRPELDHVALSNVVLSEARFRWVLKWDGDFVAHTTGPRAITHLRARLLALPPDRYYHIHLTCVEVMGDLWHQHPGWETRTDPFVSTGSRALRFVRVVRTFPTRLLQGWPSILRDLTRPVTFTFEDVKLPLYYQVLDWPEPYFFHLQVKTPLRMFLRDAWADWAENPARQAGFGSLEAYALDRARRAWGVGTLEEAAEAYMARVRSFLVPYDAQRFGEHPELLKPYLGQPAG